MTAPPLGSPQVDADEPLLRCSDAADLRGDDAAGTAAPAARWLLVEDPGPWGRDALATSRLGPAVSAALAARTKEAGVRVQLVRRHGRQPRLPAGRAHGGRRWAVAETRGPRPALRWGRWHDPHELLDLPLDGSTGRLVESPLYLVCAHGRHDACCATRGRAVAGRLAALRPDAVWETSHLGGCRFASNLVVLPHGLVYGRVPAEAAEALVEATEAGQVLPDLLRGRSALPMAAQAAEAWARQELRDDAVDAFGFVSAQLRDDGIVVELDHAGGRLRLRARRFPSGPPSLLTCAAVRPAAPTSWTVERL